MNYLHLSFRTVSIKIIANKISIEALRHTSAGLHDSAFVRKVLIALSDWYSMVHSGVDTKLTVIAWMCNTPAAASFIGLTAGNTCYLYVDLAVDCCNDREDSN